MKRSKPLRSDPEKLREWKRRSAGLKRSRKPIGPNKARRIKAYARNYGDRADVIRAMDCLAKGHGCSGKVVAAHAVARGMGGAKGDRRSLVPLCYWHHMEAGERGTSQRREFESAHSIDLLRIAEEIAARLDADGYD